MDARTNYIWASYDGSTNNPIVYPNGSSIAGLENQVLIQINSTVLPIASISGGTNYTSTLTASGGTLPYSWSVSLNSASGLPSGFTLSAVGVLGATASSITNALPGVYPITFQVTDAGGRAVVSSFTLTVTP